MGGTTNAFRILAGTRLGKRPLGIKLEDRRGILEWMMKGKNGAVRVCGAGSGSCLLAIVGISDSLSQRYVAKSQTENFGPLI